MGRFRLLLPALCCLALSVPASATSVLVNGTCEVGSCTSSDALQIGQSTSTSFNFIYVAPNTDRFQIAGSVSASLTSFVDVPFAQGTIVYLGNSTGTVSGIDDVDVDFLQYYNNGRHDLRDDAAEYLDATFFGGNVDDGTVGIEAVTTTSLYTTMAYLERFPFSSDPFYGAVFDQPYRSSGLTPVDYTAAAGFVGAEVGSGLSFTNSPVPEPPGWLLCVSGAVILAGVGGLGKGTALSS